MSELRSKGWVNTLVECLARLGVNKLSKVTATPLLRVKAKITVKPPVCRPRGLIHTAFLTVILALTLESGVALTGRIQKHVGLCKADSKSVFHFSMLSRART